MLSFDQRYNLITCIPKRAFIWNFSLYYLFSARMAQGIQRGGSKVEKKEVLSRSLIVDLNDNLISRVQH